MENHRRSWEGFITQLLIIQPPWPSLENSTQPLQNGSLLRLGDPQDEWLLPRLRTPIPVELPLGSCRGPRATESRRTKQATTSSFQAKPKALTQSSRFVFVGDRAPDAMRSTGHIGNYGFRKGRNTKSGALWRNPRNTTKLGGLAKTPMAMSGSTRAVPKYHAYALAKKDWEKRKGEGRKEEFDDS